MMHTQYARLGALLLLGTGLIPGPVIAESPIPASASPSRNNAEEALRRQAEEDVLPQINQALDAQNPQRIDTKKAADSLQSGVADSPDDEASQINNSSILDKLPSFENLKRLETQIARSPKNLDHYFAYAQMAQTLGAYDKAADAYRRMLEINPALLRVRLDLAAALLRLEELEAAKAQLSLVLEHNPPPAVQENIAPILANIEQQLQEHHLSGVVSVGINLDSNGNSAPEAGEVLILDTLIALTPQQRQQQDLQFFYAAGLNHLYKPRFAQDDAFTRQWETSLNAYRAEQSSLEALDIQVFSLKTGPRFISQASGISVRPSVGYSHIILDEQTYLRNTTLDTRIDVPLSKQFMLSGEAALEIRDFENSSTATIFEDRNGSAIQSRISGRWLATDKDIVNASLLHRREQTRRDYFDNRQWDVSLGYTRLLPHDTILNATVGMRVSLFDAHDPLISEQTRRDEERRVGLSLIHKLNDRLNLTVGYQYRDVDSNLPNYEFDNHRFLGSITATF